MKTLRAYADYATAAYEVERALVAVERASCNPDVWARLQAFGAGWDDPHCVDAPDEYCHMRPTDRCPPITGWPLDCWSPSLLEASIRASVQSATWLRSTTFTLDAEGGKVGT